jgi:uncharacterized protein YjbI with pentapeptide repeats
LADVWGWWNDSIHLRPQAEYKKGRNVYEKPAFVNDLIEHAMPFSEERELPPPPSNALDAHLGEAFCYLNVFLHNFLRDKNENNKICRKYQSIFDNEKRFKPSVTQDLPFSLFSLSKDSFPFVQIDFYKVACRINSVRTRPRFIFPTRMDLTGVDLANCYLVGMFFIETTLKFGILDEANLVHAILMEADFYNATFKNTMLSDAIFVNSSLHNADLQLARNLTDTQIKSAYIDENTKLPTGLEELKPMFLSFSKGRKTFHVKKIK